MAAKQRHRSFDVQHSNTEIVMALQIHIQCAPVTDACMHERELSHLSMVAHKPRGARLRCRGRLAAAGRRSCLGHASLHGAGMLCDNRGVNIRSASGHMQHCGMLGAMQVGLPAPAALHEGWCPEAPPRNRTQGRPPWRLTDCQKARAKLWGAKQLRVF